MFSGNWRIWQSATSTLRSTDNSAFRDGIPTEETAALLYDNLDFLRGAGVAVCQATASGKSNIGRVVWQQW
jgi:hypothetical protein